jgi:nicotinate-nucleotide adenylyltransferase
VNLQRSALSPPPAGLRPATSPLQGEVRSASIRPPRAVGPLSTRVRLPPHAPGLRIGLFGGSFNPPHAAHQAASLFALKRLGLDRVWWLVSPGNPLKETRDLPPPDDRMAAARALARHPRIDVTDIEAQIGTRYSADTVRFLRRRCPGVRFVWIMGVDNLINFHRWRDWRGFFALMPIAVIDRGEIKLGARAAPAALAFAKFRVPESKARRLAARKPPAWVLLHGLKLPVSSTTLRQKMRLRGG